MGAVITSFVGGWVGPFAVQQGPNLQPIGPAGQTRSKMVQERHPGVAEIIVGALEVNSESPSIQAVLKCARILEGAGFERAIVG